MNVIFSKTDFRLCKVNVCKGYPQSQTHVGIYYYNKNIYLTSSPFPCPVENKVWIYFKAALRKLSNGFLFPIVRGESFENPLLYIENKDERDSFQLMQSRPLMEQPDPYYGLPAFNSDPDLFIENGHLYVINRSIFRTALNTGKKRDEYIIRYYMILGQIDGQRFKYLSTRLFYESNELSVSPCMTKFKGSYVIMHLCTNCYNDGTDFNSLKCAHISHIDGIYESLKWNKINVDTSIYIPWHMSLFSYKEKLYSIVACIKRNEPYRCYQMLGVFDDNLEYLKIFSTPFSEYNSYRGSAFVSGDGTFHLYSTTVNEKLHGGKSIDGREIIHAQMNFDRLISKLEEYENSDSYNR